MADLAKRWLSWASGLVAFPVITAPLLLVYGHITSAEWAQVNIILVPAFLTLKGVETWAVRKVEPTK